MFMNPATLLFVMAASVPPEMTTSAYPCFMTLYASPRALVPDAHAETAGSAAPLQPYLIAIVPAAMLGIIIGMK